MKSLVFLLLSFLLVVATAQPNVFDALAPTAEWVVEVGEGEVTGEAHGPLAAENKGKGRLKIRKNSVLMFNDLDFPLFTGMALLSDEDVESLRTENVSHDAVRSLLEFSLGEDYAAMVDMPEEELTFLEYLRLSASLNEAERNRGRHTRADTTEGVCFCHGTANALDMSGPKGGGSFWKSAPFRGVRLFKKYDRAYGYGHFDKHHNNNHPYSNSPTYAGYARDCVLEDEAVHVCCRGLCVITPTAADGDCGDDGFGLNTYTDCLVPTPPPNPAPAPVPCYVNENCLCADVATKLGELTCAECGDWVSVPGLTCSCSDGLDNSCEDCADAISSAASLPLCDCSDWIETAACSCQDTATSFLNP